MNSSTDIGTLQTLPVCAPGILKGPYSWLQLPCCCCGESPAPSLQRDPHLTGRCFHHPEHLSFCSCSCSRPTKASEHVPTILSIAGIVACFGILTHASTQVHRHTCPLLLRTFFIPWPRWVACGSLVSWGMELVPLHWKGGVLPTGPLGKSPTHFFFFF